MITKAKLCHIFLIWGLAQATAQLNRGVPVGVRSSMIANGWRPLSTYEGKSSGQHLAGASSLSERHPGGHPVLGKLQEHMAKSEKLASKLNKQSHHQEYSPPSILGSFSVFGHSVGKIRGNPEPAKSQGGHVASETREYSFLVPPPREPVRYEIEPYRKVILRDNDVFLRQPSQYVISHAIGSDVRNGQYFGKGVAVAASSHSLATTKNRPALSEFNGQPARPPQSSQPHFESLKISNAKLYLQPPSANGPASFAAGHESRPEVYERYPAGQILPHGAQLTQESSGSFYSQINHPAPGYKNPERDPGFLVHESHEVSYATPASPIQPGFAAFGNFRPASTYDLRTPEHYTTLRPAQTTQKFVPSKPDTTRQKQENYSQYSKKNPSLENSIPSEGSFGNGLINTYYISAEQQSLTPPPPASWSPVPGKTRVTPDLNEVLPKANRPAKFNTESPNVDAVHQNQNFLFPRPEIQQQQLQQQYFQNNPLPLINQQPETIYETPESISLKHFNEQQFRLQQQLLERDRERLREQELHRQQIELGRVPASKDVTTTVVTELPRTTVQYIDTTVTYDLGNHQQEDIRKIPEQQYVQEYEKNLYEKNVYKNEQPVLQEVFYEPENVSAVPEFYGRVTTQPEKTTHETSEVSTTRTRQRKPTPTQEPVRRRKPTTTPLYEEQTYRQEEPYRLLSTLSPHPIVQSPGSLYSQSPSTEQPTPAFQETIFPSISSVTSDYTPTTTTTTPEPTTTPTTTTQKPRTRRPSTGNVPNQRRRRPSTTTTTTTQEPETSPIIYQEEDFNRYEKVETETTRRRKPTTTTTTTTTTSQTETTSTEKKKFEHYGHKLGSNEQDYVTVDPESYNVDSGQVSPQQSYSYGEQDSLFYTPSYSGNYETPGNYETSVHPTSSSSLSTRGEQENVSDAEIIKNVYTNIPLEELFVNTERTLATTPVTTTTTTSTTSRPTTTARSSHSRTPSWTSPEPTTRAPVHRMRPMRFGNTTRPRFSIKDYKSRLDYRTRMSTSTTEPPTTRQKASGHSKTHQEHENENESPESTTGRYRHMSRISYRVTSTTTTTPSPYNSRRESASSTTERINKFTPKRRLPNNHLYRSKISSTTSQSAGDELQPATPTRQTSVRNENIFSARRRLPHMKPAMFTSEPRTTRKDATEMVPEETSFYSPAISQLLVTDPTSFKSTETEYSSVVTSEGTQETSPVTASTTTANRTEDSPIVVGTENNSSPSEDPVVPDELSQPVTTPGNEPGQTEALVNESQTPIDSQLEEDLFAKASQSVADLTSSASALYNKPGMFKAVSISPSGGEGSAVIGGRFKINQEKPTLPIEAFFHELSGSKN